MKSGGSGASSATRSPGATPAARRPSAIAATRVGERGERERRPPPTATAVASSSSRATSASQQRAPLAAPPARRRRSGAAGSSSRSIQASASAATSSSSTTRCPAEREPVELGLRQPRAQVGGEAEVEDRIALAPGEQHGHVELGQALGDVRPAPHRTGAHGVVGMSATKSAIACRSSADA